MKKIAVEEHIVEDEIARLDQRLKDMDETGIDMQVLSVPFGYDESLSASEAAALASNTNNVLAGVVEKHPDRFASFAVSCIKDPEAAAKELERAVKELGLKGTMIYSAMQGTHLDAPMYRPIFEMAEKMDVPIYIHPGKLLPEMAQAFKDYPELTNAMWGFAADVGLHGMRLICSGLFDEYPKLKIILGHMGEGIPYFLWRIDNIWKKMKGGGPGPFDDGWKAKSLKKSPSQYFKENFYVTTSGMFWHPVLQFASSVLGADRIMFAVDYPPESCRVAVDFIDSMPMDDSDKEKICHLNAEKLLKL